MIWCEQQVRDCDGEIICCAHLAEARAFKCPYDNNEERSKTEYPCSDYKEIKSEDFKKEGR